MPLLLHLLVTLHLIANLKVREALETETALAAFAHFRDVFLLVFEG